MSHITEIFSTFEEIVQNESPIRPTPKKYKREQKKIKGENTQGEAIARPVEFRREREESKEAHHHEKKDKSGFVSLSRPAGFLSNIFKRQERAPNPMAKLKDKDAKLTDMFFGSENEQQEREEAAQADSDDGGLGIVKKSIKENKKPLGQNEEMYDDENSHDSFNIVQGPIPKDAPTPQKIKSVKKYNDEIIVEKGMGQVDQLMKKNLNDAKKTKMKAGGEISSSEEDEDFKALHKITRGGRRVSAKKKDFELHYEERKYKKATGVSVYQAKVPEKKAPVKKKKRVVIPKHDTNSNLIIATSGLQDFLLVLIHSSCAHLNPFLLHFPIYM